MPTSPPASPLHADASLPVSTRRLGWAQRRSVIAARFTLAVAVTLTVLGGTAARAEPADPAKAEELIREANEQRRHGHDERAVPLLRKAYEIARSARTAGQLGLAEMALGYWIPAENHLTEALAETRNPWVARNHATLDSALRATQTHLGDVRIEGQPAGAQVVVNGSVVGTLPLAGPVRATEGRVTVEARAPGRKPMSTTLTLAAQASERVQVALEPEEAPPPPPPPLPAARVVPPSSMASETGADGGERPAHEERADEARRTPRRSDTGDGLPAWRQVLPWALLGGAVAAGALGAWQQVSSQNALNDFDAIPACGAGMAMRGDDARCQGLYDDYASRRTHAFIGYGVAGVLGAGAVTLFIVNAASTPSAASTARAGQATVALGPGGALLTYAGRF